MTDIQKAWEKYLNEKELYLYELYMVYDLAEAFKEGAKAMEERLKCCGSCKWYQIHFFENSYHCKCKESKYFLSKSPSSLCEHFEPRGK